MSETAQKTALPSYDEALECILRCVSVVREASVPLDEALVRVLRANVCADRDQPPFNRSAMDGFAVVAANVMPGVTFRVTGSVPAGAKPPNHCDPSAGVLRIATGAALPNGFDATVPIELAEVNDEGEGEVVRFTIDAVEQWKNVHRRAADATQGDTVLHAGTRLGPQQIGIAASVGAATLTVSDQPRVTLLTTGDEVMPCESATDELEPQQIRNSNGPMLKALLTSLGANVLEHVHVIDEPEHIRAAAREALSHSHLVITVGGVSVGQRDFLPWAWSQLGLKTVLHGVRIQPGKPLFVASEFDPNQSDQVGAKLVIGLPGNPVSVLATAHLFVWPVLRKMQGMDSRLPWRPLNLAATAKSKGARELFRAVRLTNDGKADVIRWHGSGDLIHTGDAHGWVRLPQRDGDVGTDESIPFLPLIKG